MSYPPPLRRPMQGEKKAGTNPGLIKAMRARGG